MGAQLETLKGFLEHRSDPANYRDDKSPKKSKKNKKTKIPKELTDESCLVGGCAYCIQRIAVQKERRREALLLLKESEDLNADELQ